MVRLPHGLLGLEGRGVNEEVFCSIGNHPIPFPERYYVRVQAWAKPGRGRSGNSGSSLVLREMMSEAACTICITRIQSGLGPHQESML